MRDTTPHLAESDAGYPIAVDLAFGEFGDPELELDIDNELPAIDELDEEAASKLFPTQAARPRAKAASSPDAQISLYERLIELNLLRKMTDIVLAKVAIPWHLRADAAQEVHTAWAGLVADKSFAKNQTACYAYTSGQHAALKLRRSIGAVVAIPGALFRTGRETAFMEAIGAAVNPKDVDDYKDSLELSVEPTDLLSIARVSHLFFEQRVKDLALSAKQYRVAMKALVERKSADDIAEELGMELMYVERLLNQVTTKLRNKDALDEGGACAVTPTTRKPRTRRPVTPATPTPEETTTSTRIRRRRSAA